MAQTGQNFPPADNTDLPTEDSAVSRAIYIADAYLNMYRNGALTVDDPTLSGCTEFTLCRDLWISASSRNGKPLICLMKNKVTTYKKWWGSMADENNCYQPFVFPEDERNIILNYFNNDPRVSGTRINGGTIELYVNMN